MRKVGAGLFIVLLDFYANNGGQKTTELVNGTYTHYFVWRRQSLLPSEVIDTSRSSRRMVPPNTALHLTRCANR